MPDCADVFGFRGANYMMEELDDGAGLRGAGGVGEVVDGEDVNC